MISSITQVYHPQTLRPYQREAVDALKRDWHMQESPTLTIMATGGGKTTVISQLLTEVLDLENQRALVIAHREELIVQLASRIQNQFNGKLDETYTSQNAPGIGVVMGSLKRYEVDARLVVSSIQSMPPTRLEETLSHGDFDYFIIDEGHHVLPSNSYGKLADQLVASNPALKIAGYTATPHRGDGHGLGAFFNKISYKWDIHHGIRQGYLSPVTHFKVATRVDLGDVASRSGDYQEKALRSALDASNWLELSVQAYMDNIHSTKRPCLAFFPSVAHSKAFMKTLKAKGVKAAHIDSNTPKAERRQILRDYTEGKIEVISNCAVLTEGFDAPATSAILMARPTRNPGLFKQIVGRGTRRYPGKTDCLLVDLMVIDRRNFDQSNLLGKMRTCQCCETDFHTSLAVCPICQTPYQIDPDRYQCPICQTEFAKEDGKCPDCGWVLESDETGIYSPVSDLVGIGLETSTAQLFQKVFAAWFHGNDGYYSCLTGFEENEYAFIITPPDMDGVYRLIDVPKSAEEGLTILGFNDDLASLMVEADRIIESKGNRYLSGEAAWRSHPATPKQLAWLRHHGMYVDNSATKGEAGQYITHIQAVETYRDHLNAVTVIFSPEEDNDLNRERYRAILDYALHNPGKSLLKIMVENNVYTYPKYRVSSDVIATMRQMQGVAAVTQG